jgi:hypothetical protein
MEFYDFPYVNFIIPADELIFFRGIETTNQLKIGTTGFDKWLWKRSQRRPPRKISKYVRP